MGGGGGGVKRMLCPENFCMCAKITVYKGNFLAYLENFLYVCEKYGILGENFCMFAKSTGY